ncbi:MAG: sulfatase-like hydrolase/transferase, partial [Spirochaetaceae bacterium]|nr:sulfatase-like hydrolase/transferase [Spirochaetaceae bacterium]
MARTRPPIPDLLYIHTDQHNPFVTGCYGDAVVSTPHLDALAAAGTAFDAAYCTSPICVPSRMSMLTGRHPHQNGVWTNDHMLPSDTPTIAHAMGAAGHRPVLIGRMHSVGPDQLHGYVDRLVGDHAANYLGGVAHDMGALAGTAGPERISLRHAGAGQSPYQVHGEYVAASAVDYLNGIGVRRRAGEAAPFCLSVGLMLPHPPYVARRQDFDRYAGRVPPPHHPEPFSEGLHPYIWAWRSATGIEEVGAAEQERARAAYWGLVTRVDELVGQVFAALDANGLRERCLVVYTSDHGDMLGEHGLWWKHVFYEESIRVPLIVSWPGVVAAGRRCANVVSAVDVAATLADAMGGPPLPGSPGRSLLP